jgi:hypothetical protein
MKRLLVLAIIAAPVTAHAGHHCHEISTIVGYEQCSRFGTWSWGATLAWEMGVSALRYSADEIDATAYAPGSATSYHVVAAPGDDRAVTAAGLRLRSMLGFGRTFYLAGQFDYASITGGPHLVADVSMRGTTMTMDGGTGGFVMQSAMVLGMHRRFGSWGAAFEAGPGARFAMYTTKGLPDEVRLPGQAWFLVELQPRVDLWLTPNFSLGFVGSFDTLHPDGFAAAVVLGAHALPFDTAR